VARQRFVPLYGNAVASVFYICVFLAIVAILHRRCDRAGSMLWSEVKWHHVTQSAYGGMKPAWMALWRLSFAIYVFVILSIALSREPVKNIGDKKNTHLLGGTQVLGTFTMWSWILIGVYGLVTSAASATEAAGIEVSGKLADAVACSMWVLFQVMTSVAILIFLVVWCVLVPLFPQLLTFVSLSAHNLNVVFMLTELKINRLSFVHSHVVFSMYYGSLYIIFSWFYCISTGIVYYFFIDWRQAIVLPGYTVLIFVLYASYVGSLHLSNATKRKVVDRLPRKHLPAREPFTEKRTEGKEKSTTECEASAK